MRFPDAGEQRKKHRKQERKKRKKNKMDGFFFFLLAHSNPQWRSHQIPSGSRRVLRRAAGVDSTPWLLSVPRVTLTLPAFHHLIVRYPELGRRAGPADQKGRIQSDLQNGILIFRFGRDGIVSHEEGAIFHTESEPCKQPKKSSGSSNYLNSNYLSITKQHKETEPATSKTLIDNI